MLRCEGGCQQMCDQYYYMPNGQIFCEKCWRHGREIAEMRAIQGFNQRMQIERQFERDKISLQESKKACASKITELKLAIDLEKKKSPISFREYEEYPNVTEKPFNYEKIKLMEHQLLELQRKLNSLPDSPKLPFYNVALDNRAYFSNARFISKAQSHHFEAVIYPRDKEAERKAKQDRINAEKERQRKIEEEQKRQEIAINKHKAKLKPLEDAILRREKLPVKDRVNVAKETYREEVMLRCLRDNAITVRRAVKENPNVTTKVMTEINKMEYSKTRPKTTINVQNSSSSKQSDSGCGCFGVLVLIGIIIAIIYFSVN